MKTTLGALLAKVEAMESSRHACLRRMFGRLWPLIERFFDDKS